MKNVIQIILLSVLLSISTLSVSAKSNTITFATEPWADATNKDGTGLYWEIFRAVMVGAYKDEIDGVLYPKNHFAVDIVQAIYKKDTKQQWNGVNTMNNKIIGWIKGYSYHDYLPKTAINKSPIKRLKTRDLAYRMLNKGQIDYFIDAKADITDFFNASPIYKAADYETKTVLELNLYIVFTEDEKGKKLAEMFDRRFALLLRQGEIKKLYDKYKTKAFTYPSSFGPQ